MAAGVPVQAGGRDAGTEARHVRHQVAEGDHVLAVRREGRQVARDRRIEIELAAFDELHDSRGGRDDLGERSGIVDRVLGGGFGRGREGAMTVGLAIGGAAALEPQDAAGNFLSSDGGLDRGVDGGEFVGPENRDRRFRCGGRGARGGWSWRGS